MRRESSIAAFSVAEDPRPGNKQMGERLEKQKQAVFGRPAGLLDCTPSPWGDSVDADLLRLARLSVASKSLSKFHFLNYYFGALFT